MTPIERILAKLPDAMRAGDSWSARCPAHEDRKASLSISQGGDGRALIHCHAGCSAEAIVTALELTLRDLFPPPNHSPGESTRSHGSRDWQEEAAKFAANLDPSRRKKLAELLKLPVEALEAIPQLGYSSTDHGGRCFMFPESDSGGKIIGINRRFRDGSKKALKGSKRGLTIPKGWRDRPGPVFLVEGPTDTAAMIAAGLACIGRPSNTGGVKLLVELFKDLGPERPIIAVGENDQKSDGNWPGRTGAETIAAALTARLRRPVQWSMTPVEAKDVRDWLTADARGEMPWPDRGRELCECLIANAVSIDSAANSEGHGQPGFVRPCIVIGTDEFRVNDEAVNALAQDPHLYQRGGMLVHVIEVKTDDEATAVVRRPDPMPVIRDLPNPLIRERLTQYARWMMVRGSGEKAELVEAHPPHWCVSAVGARQDWPGVRRLEAVLPHPVILSDGTILSRNGYDAGSRLLACLPPDLTIDVPDKPTRNDVAAAVATLSDVIVDFPFEGPAHRAAWFAGILTPLAWFSFSGPAPLFLIDANVRAAGKGLLADLIALIIAGRRFPVMSYTSDREELRKRITTLAAEGDRLVLLDNLAGAVGNDVFDAALTADRWKDRLLGGNRVYDGPLHVCWYGTGNNVQLQGDTSRRICHCRMESTDERPEMRADFRHPNVRAYVRANRGQLLSAALTILRGWVVEGRPSHGLVPWGSFEEWSGVVREAVVFAGLPDPGETRVALQTAADTDANAMAALIDSLERMDPDRRGVTAGQIIDSIRKSSDPPPDWLSAMRSAIEELCGKLDSRALGYKFRHFARRNFNGRMIDRAGEDRLKGVRWIVRQVSDRPKPSPASPASPATGPIPAGDAGYAGDDPARNREVENRRRTSDSALDWLKYEGRSTNLPD